MREAVVMLLAVVASALPLVEASGQANREPKRLCFRGRPAAFCRAFWVTEVGRYWWLAGSGFVEPHARGAFERTDLDTHLSWEIGGMVNRSPATAFGATALLGGDGRGTRLGLKGR